MATSPPPPNATNANSTSAAKWKVNQDPASDSAAAADGLHHERVGAEGAEGEAAQGDGGLQGGELFQCRNKKEEVILWFNSGWNKSNAKFVDRAGFFFGGGMGKSELRALWGRRKYEMLFRNANSLSRQK